MALCHSQGPHGHPCSLVLQGCPAGKRDGVRGGGNGGPVGLGYPWGKGGCGAMRCEGWWAHKKGYSHSCLQGLGPPSHPSPQGGHGNQEGPGGGQREDVL